MELNPKLSFVADDTSLFSIVHDSNTSDVDLNRDINLICQWAYQWKMSFNPDLNKQAVQVLFSHNVRNQDPPKIYFNNIEITQTSRTYS